MSTTLPREGIPLVKFLTSAGGSWKITTDNSAGVDYFYEPPEGHGFVVHSLCVQVSDDAKFRQEDYGAITGGLTNGISFWISTNGVETPLLASIVVKKNYDWSKITPDLTITAWEGLAQTLIANLDADARFGLPLQLSSINKNKIIARTKDNFTGLVDHTLAIGGILYPLNLL